MNRATAERCTILCGNLGVTVHGLNVNDGLRDRDEMGICAKPLKGRWDPGPFDQFIYRNAAEREVRDDGRSTASISQSIALRKWTQLPQGQSDNHAAVVHRSASWSAATGARKPLSSVIRSALVYGLVAKPTFRTEHQEWEEAWFQTTLDRQSSCFERAKTFFA